VNEHIPLILLASRPAQYRMRLTVGEHSARHIRRIVRSYLDEWDMAELTDAVELGVTEVFSTVSHSHEMPLPSRDGAPGIRSASAALAGLRVGLSF